MPSLIEDWRQKTRIANRSTSPCLASLEVLVSKDKKTFGERLSIAMDGFFDNTNEGQEGRIKPS